MTWDTAWFGLAAVIFLAAVALVCRRCGAAMGRQGATRSASLIVVAVSVGGLLGAPFWWLDLPASFAWDLPPLASRILASASLAFGVVGCLILRTPRMVGFRFLLVLVAVCLVPLTLSAVVFDLNRFDFHRPVTSAFFAAALVLSTGSLAALYPPLDDSIWIRRRPLTPSPYHAALAFPAAAALAWALTLFAEPAALSPYLSLWPDDALTSRLFASVLLALAAAFVMAARDRRCVGAALCFAAVLGGGILLACLVSPGEGMPVAMFHALIFGLLSATASALLVLQARWRRAIMPSQR